MGVSMIFFSPHPDDETLAAGALIAQTPGTLIVPITAGGASGERLKFTMTAYEFETARLVEQAQAACYLGASRIAADPRYLLVDGKVTAAAAAAIMRVWRGRYPGALLASTSALDTHADHKACAAALETLRAEGATVQHCASYSGTGRGTGTEVTDSSGRAITAARLAYGSGFRIGWSSVSTQFEELINDPSDWLTEV